MTSAMKPAAYRNDDQLMLVEPFEVVDDERKVHAVTAA
jgi:hypothetical protein